MSKKTPKESFLTISVYLTGYSQVDLLGTGMLDTYYNTFVENLEIENVTTYFKEVDQILDNSGNSEEKINEGITKVLFGSALVSLTTNLITMWYTGNWGQDVISPESYTQGLIWNAAQAHPPGAKQPGYGSWADEPIEIPTI